jgi:histidinol-phosphate aminotransferase
MSIRIPKHIEELVPYKPGKPIEELLQQYGLAHATKLASNENPLGPSPKAVQAAERALHAMNLYPNGGKTIREVLAKQYKLSSDEIIAGSGSEAIMSTAMHTFLVEGDEVLTSEGTFGGFYVLAHALGLKLVLAPMKNFAYDLDAILGSITSKTRLIYLANPNNPTGSYFSKATLDKFLTNVSEDIIVMYDEAYCDFAHDAPDYPSLFGSKKPNVIALRTFSKSHGLAGIRIGYASAAPELIKLMLKVKLPFEPSEPAQAAGIAALDDTDFLNRTIQTNREGKRQFEAVFHELGIEYIPTAANFFCLTLENTEEAINLHERMERGGVIVRPLGGWGLPNCVRISIGTKEENNYAIEILREVFEPRAAMTAMQNG